MPAAIRSEWIKLRSLRSTPAILAATVVIGVLLSWILATFVKTDPNTDEAFTISQTFIFSTVADHRAGRRSSARCCSPPRCSTARWPAP